MHLQKESCSLSAHSGSSYTSNSEQNLVLSFVSEMASKSDFSVPLTDVPVCNHNWSRITLMLKTGANFIWSFFEWNQASERFYSKFFIIQAIMNKCSQTEFINLGFCQDVLIPLTEHIFYFTRTIFLTTCLLCTKARWNISELFFSVPMMS